MFYKVSCTQHMDLNIVIKSSLYPCLMGVINHNFQSQFRKIIPKFFKPLHQNDSVNVYYLYYLIWRHFLQFCKIIQQIFDTMCGNHRSGINNVTNIEINCNQGTFNFLFNKICYKTLNVYFMQVSSTWTPKIVIKSQLYLFLMGVINQNFQSHFIQNFPNRIFSFLHQNDPVNVQFQEIQVSYLVHFYKPKASLGALCMA